MIQHNGPIVGERDGLRVMQCAVCGYAHLETIPDDSALSDFYRSSFWQHEKAGALALIEDRRDWWMATYGDWLTLCEQYTAGRALLDAGCGYGHFLQVAESRGWSTAGIDLSDEAIVYAKRTTQAAISHSSWRDYRFRDFDCISALWLIEHLPDPWEFLQWAYGSLRSGGVLLAVVPRDFSLAQERVMKIVKRPFWFVDKTHINYFTSLTFSTLIQRAGFKMLDYLTTFQMETFIERGLDYTVDGKLGADLHRGIEVADLQMERDERIDHYRRMARAARGREIVMIARKE